MGAGCWCVRGGARELAFVLGRGGGAADGAVCESDRARPSARAASGGRSVRCEACEVGVSAVGALWAPRPAAWGSTFNREGQHGVLCGPFAVGIEPFEPAQASVSQHRGCGECAADGGALHRSRVSGPAWCRRGRRSRADGCERAVDGVLPLGSGLGGVVRMCRMRNVRDGVRSPETRGSA
eukprot:7183290-Prymnesium_polylepis.2